MLLLEVIVDVGNIKTKDAAAKISPRKNEIVEEKDDVAIEDVPKKFGKNSCAKARVIKSLLEDEQK